MNRKVIFVGGTAFSGSTFFHMTLANDREGFACGEIRWLFYPYRPDHVEQMNAAQGETRKIWREIRARGIHNLYETIFDLYPNVRFIVDSSKSPHWIRFQMAKLAAKGIESRNVLIWKRPQEFANSTCKRKRLQGWDHEWVNYHRLYLSLIPEWRSVQYKAYTTNNQVLEQVCNYLDIPYFEGKHDYWEKEHHSFGGNYSARFHLHEEKVAQKEYLDKTFDRDRMGTYRKIIYSDITDHDLLQIVTQAKQEIPEMEMVVNLLEKQDVRKQENYLSQYQSLRFSQPILKLRSLKFWMNSLTGRFQFNRQVNI